MNVPVRLSQPTIDRALFLMGWHIKNEVLDVESGAWIGLNDVRRCPYAAARVIDILEPSE